MCKVTSVNTNCDHLSTQKSLNMIHKIEKSHVKWFGLVVPNPSTKGQLISKCPFGVLKSFKKPTNFFPGFLP